MNIMETIKDKNIFSNKREFQFTRDEFEFLRKITNKHTGIVVSDDKFDMFYSRLSRRVRKLGMSSFHEYCELIHKEPDGGEMVELINAVTTNLTAFFRENHHFEYLKETIIPETCINRNGNGEIEVWSAGCSTGEEPYSISMCMLESFENRPGMSANITATDIDSNVLGLAARGIYTIDRVSGLEERRLKRWFMKGNGKHSGKVRLKNEVIEQVKFGQLNLMNNWTIPETKDIIFCRNVLIYFDKESKIRLLERFANTLSTRGYLFIGHSESLYTLTDRFELIGKTIYRKIK